MDCDQISGILTSRLEDQLTVYPNPIQNNAFTIDMKNLEEFELEVYDSMGRQLFSSKDHGSKVSVKLDQKIESGIFMLRLSDKQNSYTRKIISL